MNENNSRKKIQFPWKVFLIGILLSIITFLLFGKYKNTDYFLRIFSICFVGLIFAINLTLKKLGLIEINREGYVGSPPKFLLQSVRLVAMVVGHGLGFVVFMFFYQIFRK